MNNNMVQLVCVIAISISLIVIMISSILSVKGNKDSRADRYISIICSVLGTIATIISAINLYPYIHIDQRSIQVSSQGDVTTVHDNGNTIITYEINGTSTTNILLAIAKTALINGDYEQVLSILQSDDLAGNENALLDLGYMYAHGYGVQQNVALAIDIYDEIGNPQAHKNKLALLIASNRDGNNNTLILDEITYLETIGDNDIQNYLLLCYGNDALEEITNGNGTITMDLNCLYQFELVGNSSYSNPPRNTGYSVYIFTGADYIDNGSNYSLPTYFYDEYRLRFIDTIDKFVLDSDEE